MYNCARLATLFHHFDEAVQKGEYKFMHQKININLY